MKRLILFFMGFVAAGVAYSQQQAMVSQYMFNGLAINPAYAGSQEALNISVLTRFQNVGLPGAPTTQSLAVHTPLLNQRIAVGLLAVSDNISVINQTGINGIYAYRLPLPGGRTLSMGVQAGFSMYRAYYSRLDIYQVDQAFQQDVRQARPNLGAGVYYYTPRFYAGISMPHMVNNVFQRGADLETIRQTVPVIVNGGYVFTLSRVLKLKPNFLFKWVDSRAVELDINANLLFDEVIWFGFSYRASRAISWLTEIQVTEQFRFGYSFTAALGAIRQAEQGSHELLLQYRLKKFAKGVVTPRYF